MSTIVRVGIIGCGGIATAKHMPALARLKNVQMVAFFDLVEERAIEAKMEYGSEMAEHYTDFKELLANPDVDVVHVCTPNDSHSDISIAALEAGKHVMCEKPMATSAAEARKMLDTAKRTGKKLSVAYQNRYRADSLHLKSLCEEGELGEIYFAKAHAIRRRAVPTWGVFLDKEKQGGGPLIDIGTHALDLTLWMMDNYEPKMVVGNAFHKLGTKENAANVWGPWDPEKFNVEDSAFGYITMQNGATIFLESSWALNTVSVGESKCTLMGTEGGADMENGLRINGERHGKLYTTKVDLDESGASVVDGKLESEADIEARLWIEAIIEDKDPVVKPEQALIVTEILEAIYKSSETGEPVYFAKNE
ncbi:MULTISPECIES: Gfo/Idh/MocA family protein [Bacillaceae]|uniref:Gfo/Idh/MocA family protein n=1 Tax=Bacillaceae TaxID=186817 RepID=UPI000C75CE8C|nr:MULTISPECIES: Gfo/Idh/MocA family oxidoreductase [Bacillaceae]PLR69338.1 oxidoreductase [Bacillus sp. UMB0893]